HRGELARRVRRARNDPGAAAGAGRTVDEDARLRAVAKRARAAQVGRRVPRRRRIRQDARRGHLRHRGGDEGSRARLSGMPVTRARRGPIALAVALLAGVAIAAWQVTLIPEPTLGVGVGP